MTTEEIQELAKSIVKMLDDESEFIDHFFETAVYNKAFTEDGIEWEKLTDYEQGRFMQMAVSLKFGV